MKKLICISVIFFAIGCQSESDLNTNQTSSENLPIANEENCSTSALSSYQRRLSEADYSVLQQDCKDYSLNKQLHSFKYEPSLQDRY